MACTWLCVSNPWPARLDCPSADDDSGVHAVPRVQCVSGRQGAGAAGSRHRPARWEPLVGVRRCCAVLPCLAVLSFCKGSACGVLLGSRCPALYACAARAAPCTKNLPRRCCGSPLHAGQQGGRGGGGGASISEQGRELLRELQKEGLGDHILLLRLYEVNCRAPAGQGKLALAALNQTWCLQPRGVWQASTRRTQHMCWASLPTCLGVPMCRSFAAYYSYLAGVAGGGCLH